MLIRSLILGEIVVARIHDSVNAKQQPICTVEVPAAMLSSHPIARNEYANVTDATEGAKYLVPANCRDSIKIVNV